MLNVSAEIVDLVHRIFQERQALDPRVVLLKTLHAEVQQVRPDATFEETRAALVMLVADGRIEGEDDSDLGADSHLFPPGKRF